MYRMVFVIQWSGAQAHGESPHIDEFDIKRQQYSLVEFKTDV
jgi:hypothetical protein